MRPTIGVLVSNYVTGAPNQVVAVDLITGNRTVAPLTGTSSDYQVVGEVALDAANQRLFLSAYPRANVVQVNLATNQQTRFADSNVGTGPMSRRRVGPARQVSRLRRPCSPRILRRCRAHRSRHRRAQRDRDDELSERSARPSGRAICSTTRVRAFPRIGCSIRTLSRAPRRCTHSTSPRASARRSRRPPRFRTAHNRSCRSMPANGRLLISVAPAFGQIADPAGQRGDGRGRPGDRGLHDRHSVLRPFERDGARRARPGILNASSRWTTRSILYAINTANGNRTIVSSNASVGSGPPLAYADSIAINPATRRALLVSGSHNSILEVDLLTGNRTMVSGRNLDDQVIRGTGPLITPLWSRIARRFLRRRSPT